MLIRRGYDPKLSFAAFDDGRMVAFSFTGTGTFDGVPTAYDIATGTVKEYRGRGVAGMIFNHALPFLKEAGVRQYMLEVLQTNDKAIAVYRKMNFEVTRELDCFRQSVDCIDYGMVNDDCTVDQIDVESVRLAGEWCDFVPSWQNSFESIGRGASGLTCLGAFVGGIMEGYCVFDPQTGDLTQIAVGRGSRRNGIASRLFKEATSRFMTGAVKVLNVGSDDAAMAAFLKSRNIPLSSKQYEMRLLLRPKV